MFAPGQLVRCLLRRRNAPTVGAYAVVEAVAAEAVTIRLENGDRHTVPPRTLFLLPYEEGNMAFRKLVPTKYPPRHWAIVGAPSSGKSTFAAQMIGPMLVIDSDHRFQEVARLAAGDIFTLADAGNDAELIARDINENMAGSGVNTVIIDSLTAIITPLVTQAILDNDAGLNKNKVSAFKTKALAMRLLQDTVTAWGTDTLWIYHTRQGLDGQAREVESTTISAVDLARLRRSLNMTLRVIAHGDKRGIVVDWARRGRSGITLWDDTGAWRGMPARIEAAVYDGLSHADQDKLEQGIPTSFSGPNAAIAWGFEMGAFRDAVHAANAYEKVKNDHQPTTAAEMWQLWIADVIARGKMNAE